MNYKIQQELLKFDALEKSSSPGIWDGIWSREHVINEYASSNPVCCLGDLWPLSFWVQVHLFSPLTTCENCHMVTTTKHSWVLSWVIYLKKLAKSNISTFQMKDILFAVKPFRSFRLCSKTALYLSMKLLSINISKKWQ